MSVANFLEFNFWTYKKFLVVNDRCALTSAFVAKIFNNQNCILSQLQNLLPDFASSHHLTVTLPLYAIMYSCEHKYSTLQMIRGNGCTSK